MHAEFPSHKNFQNTETVAKQLCFYFNHGSITRELSRIFWLFWIPKSICSLIKLPEKILNKNFPTQKNPKIKNFKPQKVLGSSLSLEIRIILAGQRVVFELACYKLMTSDDEIISKWKSYTLSLSVPKSFERDETVRCYQQPILSKEVSS